MTTHAEEFRAELATALSKAFDEAGVTVTSSDLDTTSFGAILNAVATATWDWRVSKGAPKSHERPEYEGPPMVRFAVTTKPREFNDDEQAARDRYRARFAWKYRGKDQADVEPPEGVTRLDLLEQNRWWITKDETRVKLVDMNPGHRANTLALLERQASEMHLAHSMSSVFVNAPEDVQVELEREDPREWLSRQPLIKRLRKMVKADKMLAGDDE